MIGIGSIIPFMTVASNPKMIETNAYLKWAYSALSRLGYQSGGECITIEGVAVQLYGSTPVPVLSAEYLIAIAIQTGRPKDRVRVRMLLDEATIDMSVLDDILKRHSLKEHSSLWLN